MVLDLIFVRFILNINQYRIGTGITLIQDGYDGTTCRHRHRRAFHGAGILPFYGSLVEIARSPSALDWSHGSLLAGGRP